MEVIHPPAEPSAGVHTERSLGMLRVITKLFDFSGGEDDIHSRYAHERETLYGTCLTTVRHTPSMLVACNH